MTESISLRTSNECVELELIKSNSLFNDSVTVIWSVQATIELLEHCVSHDK